MPKREYFKAIPAAYVVLERDSDILLLRRDNTTYFDGYFSLIAGHIEQGESARTAAVREASEEAGIKINPKDLRLLHIMNRPAVENNGDTRIDFFFAANKWQGQVRNVETHKCSELKWVNKDMLPKAEIVPEVYQALSEGYKGSVESEFGW